MRLTVEQPSFKARLEARIPLIGTYAMLPSPDVVELLALAGMDYVIIDTQHVSPDWSVLGNMVRAADARGIEHGISALVRRGNAGMDAIEARHPDASWRRNYVVLERTL